LIGWSPSGDRLLAEVNLWTYDSDAGYDHVPLIYNAHTDSAKEISGVDQVVSRHFGPNCEFELAVTGWKTDDQILVKVSQSPTDGSYEQHFCVKSPLTFVFGLRSKTLQAYQLPLPNKD